MASEDRGAIPEATLIHTGTMIVERDKVKNMLALMERLKTRNDELEAEKASQQWIGYVVALMALARREGGTIRISRQEQAETDLTMALGSYPDAETGDAVFQLTPK